MNTAKRLLKTIGNLFFVLLVSALVFVTAVAVLARIGGSGNMLFGKYGFGRIVTGSMEPDIPTGSFVLVEKMDASDLQIGDVIMFHSDDPDVPEGMPVSHAITQINSIDNGTRSFTTKGTANAIEDTYPVREEAVIGKVVWHSMALGSVVAFSQQTYIYPVLILLLGANLIFNMTVVVGEAKALRNKEEQNQSI